MYVKAGDVLSNHPECQIGRAQSDTHKPLLVHIFCPECHTTLRTEAVVNVQGLLPVAAERTGRGACFCVYKHKRLCGSSGGGGFASVVPLQCRVPPRESWHAPLALLPHTALSAHTRKHPTTTRLIHRPPSVKQGEGQGTTRHIPQRR